MQRILQVSLLQFSNTEANVFRQMAGVRLNLKVLSIAFPWGANMLKFIDLHHYLNRLLIM